MKDNIWKAIAIVILVVWLGFITYKVCNPPTVKVLGVNSYTNSGGVPTVYTDIHDTGDLGVDGAMTVTGASSFTGAVTLTNLTATNVTSTNLAVSGATTLATTTINAHLIVGAGTPTVAVGGAGWTAGTLSGDDVTGSVSSTPAASVAGQITVNFTTVYASAPVCNISLASTLGASPSTSTNSVFVTSSASAFSINFPTPTVPQAYRFNYICLQ